MAVRQRRIRAAADRTAPESFFPYRVSRREQSLRPSHTPVARGVRRLTGRYEVENTLAHQPAERLAGRRRGNPVRTVKREVGDVVTGLTEPRQQSQAGTGFAVHRIAGAMREKYA